MFRIDSGGPPPSGNSGREIMMKKSMMKKAGAAGLAVCVAATTGIAVHYTPVSRAKTVDTQKAVEKNYPNLLTSSTTGKDETTYVIMNNDGDTSRVYVDEWLKNGKDKKNLKDRSDLKNIENTSGNEKYTKKGSNLTWHADGKDIRYQGTTNRELPVEVQVSYYLNGKEVSADEIAGKSGNVEIHFDYHVNRMETVSADGKGYTMSHPYTMASGLVLNNSHFTDVSVTNGKAVNDGDNTVAVGIAFPGLADNLNLHSKDFNIPEKVVVKAKAKNFKLDGTYSVAASGILGDVDTSKANSVKDKMNQLTDGLDELTAASAKLVSGSARLSNGADKLAKGTDSLQEGVKELAAGTNALYSGSRELKSGSGKLVAGAAQLSGGLATLAGNNAKLNQATQQLESQVFGTVQTQVNTALKAQGMKSVSLTPANYKQVLNGISGSAVTAAESQLKAAVVKSAPSLAGNESAVNGILSLAYNKLAARKIMKPSQAQLQQAIGQAAGDAQKAAFVASAVKNYSGAAQKVLGDKATPETVQGTAIAIALAVQNKEDVSQVQNIVKYQDAAKEYGAAALDYQTASKEAGTNVKALAAMAAASDSKAQEAMKGLKNAESTLDSIVSYTAAVSQYTAGVASASSGASQLYAGIKKLDGGIGTLESGAKKLNDGVGTLTGGADQLGSGADQLSQGADQLASGMKKFNDQGIKKLVSSLDDNQLTDMSSRLKAAAVASGRPVFMGGKLSGMDGESKIIYKTGGINDK